MMASNVIPSKRPFERSHLEPSGRGKWQKTATSGFQKNQQRKQPGSITFRVLCPASKSGSFVGDDACVVKIMQDTGAKITLQEAVPGCNEIVITITSPEKDDVINEQNKKIGEVGGDQNKESDETVDSGEKQDEKMNEGGGDPADVDIKGDSVVKEEKETSAKPDSNTSDVTPPALRALLLVCEWVYGCEESKDGGEQANVAGEEPTVDGEKSTVDKEESNITAEESDTAGTKKSSEGNEPNENVDSVSLRLLVLSSQAGCILGKKGSMIKQISSESGARIRILVANNIPACASPQDSVVQITGRIDSVRMALNLVAMQLWKNFRVREVPAVNSSGLVRSFGSVLPPDGLQPNYPVQIQGPPLNGREFGIPDFRPSGLPVPPFGEPPVPGPQVPPEKLTLRLLSSNDKVGCVIGKGGIVVKTIESETGCEIKVNEIAADSDDRVVVITGLAHPMDRISPVQDAILRVYRKLVINPLDKKENSCKLIISSHQIGPILGKGGSVIAEMRKSSGASITVSGKEQVPKALQQKNDELVTINGELEAIQEALMLVTSRLKDHLFRNKIPPQNLNMHHPFGPHEPAFGSYIGRPESSPPRFFPDVPYQKNFPWQTFEERPPFAHGPGSLGSEQSAHWAPQGMREVGGPITPPDFPGRPPRRIGGLSGPSQPTIIPNITVEVAVPRALLPALYGEDGGCLRRIREFSEAKITINDPRPQATETLILISGTPEQSHAAQSLIQAFVLSETSGL